MPVIPHLFSLSGLAAGAKLLCFGTIVARLKRLAAEVCSLKIEHVSPELVVPQEICRCTPSGRLAVRWGEGGAAWRRLGTRKPDAGFLLPGIPATLLDARELGRWLKAGADAPAAGAPALALGRMAALR